MVLQEIANTYQDQQLRRRDGICMAIVISSSFMSLSVYEVGVGLFLWAYLVAASCTCLYIGFLYHWDPDRRQDSKSVVTRLWTVYVIPLCGAMVISILFMFVPNSNAESGNIFDAHQNAAFIAGPVVAFIPMQILGAIGRRVAMMFKTAPERI